MKYVAVIEHGETGWGAYVPDLPGCTAVGPTRDFVAEKIREAILLHVESLREHGEAVPEAAAFALTVDSA
jgi:predicted RNase H-like HicB family nuclease